MKNIAIFASGSGTNAEKIIRYFKRHKLVKVAVVLSNKTDAGVHARAQNLGVPSFSFTNAEFREGTKILSKLAEYEVCFIALAGYLPLVSPVLIDAFKGQMVNIHPALLPEFGGKGMYGHHVHEAVIASGKTLSGITIHYVNENYDEGAIIFQATVHLKPSETAETLEAKIHRLEYQYYPKIIEEILTENENCN